MSELSKLPNNRIKDIALFFDSLSDKELQVLKHWIKNSIEETLAKTAVNILDSKKEEVIKMVASNAFILSEMEEKRRAEGRAEGRAKGIKEGRAEGIKEGIKQGIKEGKEDEKLEIAKNLLDVLTDEIIAEKTGLSIDIVKDLRKKNS